MNGGTLENCGDDADHASDLDGDFSAKRVGELGKQEAAEDTATRVKAIAGWSREC